VEDFELAYRVDSIEFEQVGGPSHILIRTNGVVRRPGYVSPLLIIHSTAPDLEGRLTYYFAAQPPTGGSPGELVPIQAERFLFGLNRVKSITVVSATNAISKIL
jgi:hypothetical protein